ncbi:type ISP restriction/modification enzyme [Mycolicibacterium llatzerense]|uniref:type ISP restriction/modification enzyme n=1 Tax=Mycolicibacterium llatzerense TaxID=280871 RepID=UPI00361E0CC9
MPNAASPRSVRSRKRRIHRKACVGRYGDRSFDRQWIVADSRFLDFPRPPLWAAVRITKQIFIVELHSHPISDGPGIVFSRLIPDVHHFQQSRRLHATVAASRLRHHHHPPRRRLIRSCPARGLGLHCRRPRNRQILGSTTAKPTPPAAAPAPWTTSTPRPGRPCGTANSSTRCR